MGQASDLAVTVGEVHRGWYFEVRNSVWFGVESASVVSREWRWAESGLRWGIRELNHRGFRRRGRPRHASISGRYNLCMFGTKHWAPEGGKGGRKSKWIGQVSRIMSKSIYSEDFIGQTCIDPSHDWALEIL